jgi:hypothetical protein
VFIDVNQEEFSLWAVIEYVSYRKGKRQCWLWSTENEYNVKTNLQNSKTAFYTFNDVKFIYFKK